MNLTDLMASEQQAFIYPFIFVLPILAIVVGLIFWIVTKLWEKK